MATTLLATEIALASLVGFFAMGIDKRRARMGVWRIPERVLFAIAILGGSLGVLVGIYVFRHKTRHATFTVGIPAIIIVQAVLIVILH